MYCSFASWRCSLPASLLRMCAHAYFLFLFGVRETIWILYQRIYFFHICVNCCFLCIIVGYIVEIFVMASPAQRRGSCCHMMARFDNHKKCALCRDKVNGKDACVKGDECNICDDLTDTQHSNLATPQYQILKEKKSGPLVSHV